MASLPISHLFRYAFGGALAILLWWILDENPTERIKPLMGLTKETGMPPAVLATILTVGVALFGAFIYLVYRLLIGTMPMLYLYRAVHSLYDRIVCCAICGCKDCQACDCEKTKRHSLCKTSCPYTFIECKYKVCKWDSVNAYRLIRQRHFDGVFEVEHAELHILYMTSFLCTVALLLSMRQDVKNDYNWQLAGIAIGCLLLALLGDIGLGRRECTYLRALDKGALPGSHGNSREIHNLLVDAGLTIAPRRLESGNAASSG